MTASVRNDCHWVAHVLLLWLGSRMVWSVCGLSADGKVLLEFKAGIQDVDGVLLDWDAGSDTPCSWEGVTCDQSSSVVELNLQNANLTGLVPATLCQLPKLAKLDLSLNFIGGNVPSGFLDCVALEYLDLSSNLIVDVLPADIWTLPSLRVLNLSYNNFSGVIPESFGDFPKLTDLDISANLLEGSIPPHIGNVSTLVSFKANANTFKSSLPAEFGKLKNLQVLQICCAQLHGEIPALLGNTNLTELYLAKNSLTGSLPPELGKLKRLWLLDVSNNALTGAIPSQLMFLPNLRQLQLYNNGLIGPIPQELGNLTSLEEIDLSANELSGSIPDGISQLHNLRLVHFFSNCFNGSIPDGVASLASLRELQLFMNSFTGEIPPNLGRLSRLVSLDLSSNSLSGPIPPGLCTAGALESLILFDNQLSGVIPEGLGNCPALQRIRLQNNKLNGTVPVGIWNYATMKHLELSNNKLEGSMSFGQLRSSQLEALLVNDNHFSGSLPAAIASFTNLVQFRASDNNFVGEVPKELGNLSFLSALELGNNLLEGHIPDTLSQCSRLSTLNFSSNHLKGSIPAFLGSLPALNVLDLSYNELSGPVPPELGNLHLSAYNFSYNNLSGVLPEAFIGAPLESSFAGNPALCFSTLGCGMSPIKKSVSPAGVVWAVVATFTAAFVILLVGGFLFWRKYHSSYRYWSKKDPDLTWSLTSFQKVNFTEEEVMERLDEDNVIGSGGSGKVYKVILSDGQAVAVKKLWTSPKGEARRDNGFKAEVETLGKIRHRNIVKLLCCCSNRKANLLVYQYMPNGSVGDILHNPKTALVLDWPTRYQIAVGAAEGLAYLHHDCVPPIVHRDVKSNNILLDSNFEAHVADFGLAKLLGLAPEKPDSMSAVAGSYGYIAPEYGYTLKVTEKSDIYSFGVVLLELVSGRKPLDPEFSEGDVVKWVSKKVETKAGIVEALDSTIRDSAQDDMIRVLKVGLLCTNFLPSQRPPMRDVVQMLAKACPSNQAMKYRTDSITKDPAKSSSVRQPRAPSAFAVKHTGKWELRR
ncbi:hypothetical protein R1sor_012966 [Riccia sorocarpa]|uniref:non-specific serine/threonine protein kinase n=1 Tax=Riccia sorocarpa TaxID=122646 RepID=A0ABD3I8W8_9MARC